MEIKENKDIEYKYTCIIDSGYHLALYLLQCREEDINRTAFFICNHVPQSIYQRLPNYVVYRMKNIWDGLYFRIICLLKWRYRYRTKIYACDSSVISYALIGRAPYIYIEDAPGIYERASWTYEHKELLNIRDPLNLRPSKIKKILGEVFGGPTYAKCLGRNNQCRYALVTGVNEDDAILSKNVVLHHLDICKMYKSSSNTKISKIFEFFNITSKDIETCKNKKILFLTDPLMEDYGFSASEVFLIYNKYLSIYRTEDILIKPHVRDNFDYSIFFPKISVWKTYAPMQLLSLLDICFDTVITPESSAVIGLKNTNNIIFINFLDDKKILRQV